MAQQRPLVRIVLMLTLMHWLDHLRQPKGLHRLLAQVHVAQAQVNVLRVQVLRVLTVQVLRVALKALLAQRAVVV